MIIEQILVTNMAVFCYLIIDEKTKEALLIDPAGDYHKINDAIDKHKAQVKIIINTHGHFDHTSGNEHFIKKYQAKLMIHASDSKKLTSIPNKLLTKATGNTPSPKTADYLKDGDLIKVGKTSLKVIHTPGHSPGSVCLYNDGNVFTGDTLFTEGMGRSDLPGGSQKEIMKSIRKKILTLPDKTLIWPGHHYGRNKTSTVKEQKRIYL